MLLSQEGREQETVKHASKFCCGEKEEERRNIKLLARLWRVCAKYQASILLPSIAYATLSVPDSFYVSRNRVLFQCSVTRHESILHETTFSASSLSPKLASSSSSSSFYLSSSSHLHKRLPPLLLHLEPSCLLAS